MVYEKQVFGALRNTNGDDACNNILLVGDLNRNGWNDLVVCGHSGKLAILKNGESYRRWENVVLDDKMAGVGTAGLLCDVNGDGYADIVLCGDEASDWVVWYENPGKSGKDWERHEAFATGNAGFSDAVYAVNLMGDGKSGILFANAGDNGTNVLYAALPVAGEWQPVTLASDLMDVNVKESFTAPASGLAVGDLDGDGSMEFVCGNHWFKKQGDTFVAHEYCSNKVNARIVLCDVDGSDTLAILACEKDAVSEYQLPGATLSLYRQGLDIAAPWEETVLAEDILDCGLLTTGKMSGETVDILIGEVGLEGPTSGLCSFKKPAHLGGFDFSSETTRYVASGKAPQTFAFVKSGEGYERRVVAESGLFAGALCDVLHNGSLSLVGIPKIGSERWGIQCYTAIDAPKTLFG